jgi:hypothetical protein
VFDQAAGHRPQPDVGTLITSLGAYHRDIVFPRFRQDHVRGRTSTAANLGVNAFLSQDQFGLSQDPVGLSGNTLLVTSCRYPPGFWRSHLWSNAQQMHFAISGR